MADDEQFSLCWNNFNSNLSAGFHESLCQGDLVDVTLAAEGQLVKAHRLVLSVCSPYFRKMFTQMPANQHAFVFLKDVSHSALKDLIQFMYCGEVNVKQDALPAFISTAEALQIKGLTDSEPAPPSQSPAKPSTPAPHTMATAPTLTSVGSSTSAIPRVRQQKSTSSSRTSYKLESEDSGDEKSTQIVIQTTATPTQTIVQSQKRPAQRSITPHTISAVKRVKTVPDPLENPKPITQIPVQNITESKSTSSPDETEFIDLPMDLPTKSEPDYTEEGGDVDGGDQEATYVEDDSYGDMKYDESYFTENDESGAVAATTSSAVKQQAGTFSESYVSDAGDQSTTEAQVSSHDVQYIRSQKKNPQIVYQGYIYNKKLTQANGHTTWRCCDVLKTKCKAVVVTKNSRLVVAKRHHCHSPHWARIGNRPLYAEEEDLGSYIEVMQINEENDDNKRLKSSAFQIKTMESSQMSKQTFQILTELHPQQKYISGFKIEDEKTSEMVSMLKADDSDGQVEQILSDINAEDEDL